MFGHNTLLEKINPVLDEYQKSIVGDEAKTDEYFSFFWFFKREELLAYYYSKISGYLEPVNPKYYTEYAMNEFVWSKDNTLTQLEKFFLYPKPEFKTSLELAFEYCRKKPESLPEFIHAIREKMLFDQTDERSGFLKQVTLFDLLIEKTLTNQPHYRAAFFELSLTFLAHQYQITKSVKQNAISFYQYPIPFTDIIKTFRQKIWGTFKKLTANHKEKVKQTLQKFSPGLREPDKNLWIYNLDFFLPILSPLLDPNNIEDIEFVQQFADRMKRLQIEDARVNGLAEQYSNQDYSFLKKFDWNYLKGKQDFEVENLDEFRRQKELQLRKDFVFTNITAADQLFRTIENILKINGGKGYALQQSLDIIVEENFIRNQKVGFEILQFLLTNYPPQMGVLPSVVHTIANSSPGNAKQLLNLLKNWDHQVKDFWLLTFFGILKNEFIDSFFTDELVNTINNLTTSCYLSFEDFEKYEVFEPAIIEKALRVYLNKNSVNNLRLTLSYHFFEKYTERLASHTDLLQQAYFMQESLDNQYDFGKAGLQQLIKFSLSFLKTYIDRHFPEGSVESKDLDSHLSFIWDLDLSYEILETVTDTVIQNSFNFGEHDLNIFYKNHTPERLERAKAFLNRYSETNINKEDRINAVVSVILHSIPDYFEDFLLQYLFRNPNVEEFKKIWWTGNGGIYSGDVIIGEVHAAAWQKVLEIIDKFPEQLPMLPIKAHIKSLISEEMKSAELERQRKFSNPKW